MYNSHNFDSDWDYYDYLEFRVEPRYECPMMRRKKMVEKMNKKWNGYGEEESADDQG